MICKDCKGTKMKSRTNYSHGTKSKGRTTMSCKACGSMNIEKPSRRFRRR